MPESFRSGANRRAGSPPSCLPSSAVPWRRHIRTSSSPSVCLGEIDSSASVSRDAVPKTSARRAQQKLCRDPKTRVRASYRTAGTPPRQTARMFQPHSMPNAHGAGRPPAAQQGPKVKPPGNPQQEPRRGRPTQRGIPQNPQRTSGNPESAAATFFKQWPIRPVLGAAKLRSLRFEATGSRGVLKQGGNQGEQRTPK